MLGFREFMCISLQPALKLNVAKIQVYDSCIDQKEKKNYNNDLCLQAITCSYTNEPTTTLGFVSMVPPSQFFSLQ